MEDTRAFHEMNRMLREFYLSRGFVEVPTQGRRSILAACENPDNIMTYECQGQIWPLPQTGQMWLEFELLRNPNWPGVFCQTTSYRNELNPKEGRHNIIFPMSEFECRGSLKELKKFERDLVRHLGFKSGLVDLDYELACERYGVQEIEAEQEEQIGKDFGSVVLLQKFPRRTHPFWNMKYSSDETANKVDVLLYGMETIGSAERSSDVEAMRDNFHSVSDGRYAATLYKLFTKERVEKELNDFLSLPMTPRFGGGMGMTRLARAMKLEGLL